MPEKAIQPALMCDECNTVTKICDHLDTRVQQLEAAERTLNESHAAVRRLTDELAKMENRADHFEAEAERLLETLEFYADPDTYFAWAMVGDRPCGEWGSDFEADEDGAMRPGKRARAALGGPMTHHTHPSKNLAGQLTVCAACDDDVKERLAAAEAERDQARREAEAIDTLSSKTVSDFKQAMFEAQRGRFAAEAEAKRLKRAVTLWFKGHDHDCPKCKAIRAALKETT